MPYDGGVQAAGLAQPPLGDGFGRGGGAGEDAAEETLSRGHVAGVSPQLTSAPSQVQHRDLLPIYRVGGDMRVEAGR